MKKILLIEDDPVILKLYAEALERQGVEVRTASDGVEGLTALARFTPDLVVLDLLMPRLSGHEVLKVMRERPEWRNLPVIVFSNSYLGALTKDAIDLGIDRAALKTSCSPPALAQMIDEVLKERQSSRPPAPVILPGVTREDAASTPAPATPAEFDFRALARQKFLASAETRIQTIWKSFQHFASAEPGKEKADLLRDFYRNVHSLTTASGLANNHDIAQLSMVFEALLHQVVEKPGHLTHSVLRTISAAVDDLTAMFGKAEEASTAQPPRARALVVDDDLVSARVISNSLKEARFDATGVEDPIKGLQMIAAERFDMVLLDVEMPGMNGMEFCRRLRKTLGYEKVPVIYVTGHSDFDTRAKTILSGGTDLIAKPIFPLELATKAVMHLLRAAR